VNFQEHNDFFDPDLKNVQGIEKVKRVSLGHLEKHQSYEISVLRLKGEL